MRSDAHHLPRATPSSQACPRRWGLEALEPRVLLSADPVLGAVQAVLLHDAGDGTLDGAYPGGHAIDAAALIDGAAAGLLVIGQPGSSQAIVLDRGAETTVLSPADLQMWADGTGGEVRLASPLVAASLEVNGSGHTTTLSADQNVTVGSFSINDSLRVDGQRSITATVGSILLGGNSTHFLGGNSAVTVDTLTLSAPNGNITVRGPVGDGQEVTDALSGLTVTAAVNVTFQQSVVMDGDLVINASGLVSFQDQLTLRNGADLIIQGASQVSLQGRVLMQTGSASTPGVFTISANEIELVMGEELIQGSGAVTLRPATLGTPIAVLSPPGALTGGVLNIESSELRAFADGFASFTIGHVGGDGHALAGSGAVSVGANTTLDGLAFQDRASIYGGSITLADYGDRNAVFRLGAGDPLLLDAVGDITLVNEVEVDRATLVSATGRVQQTDANADNRIGEALRTPDLLVQAVTGVNLPSIEGQRVDVVNSGAGDITLGVGVARATTRFAATVLDGDIDLVRVAQTAPSGGNDVAVTTAGGGISLLAGPGISVAGDGGISLQARGAGADINLAAPLGVGSGAVVLNAADELRSTAAGTITASGAAPITLTSGTGVLALLAPVSSAGGPVSFNSGAALDLSGVTVSGGAAGVVALQAAGTLTLGVVDASSTITLGSTGGAIVDGLAGDAANLVGDAAAVVMNAAQGVGTASAPLRMRVGSVEAHSSTGGGLFLAEETALSVAAGGLSTAGNGSGIGAIVLRTAAGSLDVQGAVSANATGAGSGHILLQAQGTPGDLSLAADVVSASGSISLLASQALLLAGPGAAATVVRAQAAGQTLDLRAGSGLTMAAEARLQTNNGAQRLEANGAVVLGQADAGTGTLSVQAGGAITGAVGAPVRTDLSAGALRLGAATGAVGSAADAIGFSATSVSALAAGGGVFLAGAGASTVASVAGAPALRVAADGTAAALPVDTAQAGITAGGAVVLQLAAGTLSVGAGSGGVTSTSQHVLLATPGDIALAAAVTATAGQVSVLAGGAMTATDAGDISAGAAGGIDLQAGAALSLAAGSDVLTSGGAVRVQAGGDLALGRLNAGSGALALSAANITGLAAGTDLSGGDLRIQASGAVGSGADPLTLQVLRLAASAAGNGLYLQELDALEVADLPLATGQRVGTDGLLVSAPPTDAALAGLTSGGALVLQAGGALALAATAPVQAAGALRLSAGAGADLTLPAAVSSTGGAISLAAGRDLLLSAPLASAGAGRSLDLSAGRDLLMADGATLQTVDGAQVLQAGGNIGLRELDAGNAGVALVAGASVIDGDAAVDVRAGTLVLRAGGGIGSGGDALETDVALLGASAGAGGAFVDEQTALVLGAASVTAQRVAADGSVADLAPLAQQGLAATAGGALVLQVLDGDLQVDAAIAGSGGALRLDVRNGALTLAAGLASGGGAVSLLASGVLQQTAAAQVQTGGGSLDLQAAAVTMADGATLESAGGAVRVAADGAFTVARLDAGAGSASVRAAAVRDVANEAGSGADITAGALRLAASGTATTDGVGSAADALELAVGQLAVAAQGGGVFLVQDGALLLDTVGPLDGARVQSDGTVQAAAVQDAALGGLASAGALVLRVNAALQGSAAAALSAAGNLLVQTQGAAADLQAAGAITSSAGHVSLLAGRDLRLAGAVTTTTTARTLDLEAGRDIVLAEGSSLESRNGAIRLQAGGSATLESLNAGTAGVAVQAGAGSILDGDAPGDSETDITAAAVLLQAGGAVGQGTNALETAATTLSALASAGGAFLTETSGLRVDAVSVTVNRVAADASAAALTAVTQEDLRTGDASALTVTVLAGDLTVAGGTLTAATGVDAGGAVLLDARTGKVALDSALQSAGGAVSVLARTDLALAAAGDISTTGAATVDLQAGGNMTMADGATVHSGSGNLRLAVTGTLTLGALQTTGDVSLAARSVTDSGGADVDIAAASLRVATTGATAGQGFGTGAQAIDLTVARLAATVAGSGAGGLFIQEADGLVVDTVAAIAVDRVAANGSLSRGTTTDGALSDLNSLGNLVLASRTGTLALREANGDNRAVQAVGNVRLDASAGDLLVDGAVRTSAGHVSLSAFGQMQLNADVAITRAGRTVDLLAGGPLAMAASAVVSTVNSDVRLQSGGALSLGQVAAGSGNVSLVSTGASIVEAGRDDAVEVVAAQLRLQAADSVGSADNRLETLVGTVSARAAGGGIWLQDNNGVTVGDTSATVRRVGSAGTVTDVVDAVQSDLVTTGGNGSIALRTVDGDIDLTDGSAPADGRSVTADGSGVISLSAGGATSVLDATSDNIRQQGPVVFDSALRIQGTLQVSAGLGAGAGDGAITLQRAVDGNPGGVPDLLQLHADGPVRVQGAVGATQALDGLSVDGATDVLFEQAVHLAGNLDIQASGVVEFRGPLTLDGAAALRIVGASQVILNGVVVGTGDVTLQADDVQITGPVQSGGGALTVTTRSAGQAITLDDNGAGLVLDAAELARLTGFSRVDLGDSRTGAVAMDAQALAALQAAAVNIEGSRIDVQGSGTLAAGTDLLLNSRGAITMTADAQLSTAGGDVSLQAAGDLALGRLTAALVRLDSSAGTISDAANDLALNVTADRLVMRGTGPALPVGVSSTTAAIDVSAPTLEVDAGRGVVLRDSAPGGSTRFNLLVGDALFQQLEATGPAQRTATAGTAERTLAATLEPAEVAAWLGATRPLAELRHSTAAAAAWASAAVDDEDLARASAAVRYLADNTAWSDGPGLASQRLSTGPNLGGDAAVWLWLDAMRV